MLDSVSSPFALVAPTLVANGYSAIPIMPGAKRPGLAVDCGMTEWTRFCDRLPTKIETDIWSLRPDIGVGVALGAASRGLVAIDIDTDDLDVIEAIESRWPSTIRKVGRKGYTAFYWASAAVTPRPFKSETHGGLDLLAHGRQTILPPTRHKDTGEAYRWLTPRTLENTIVDELPMLPDDIAAQLAEALAPFWFVARSERQELVRVPVDSDDIWATVKAAALANFDAWVPDLDIDAKRQHNGNWRGRAVWKQAENANVGFDPKGIVDFGDDRGMTAIDVVVEALGLSAGEALDWLKTRLGIDDAPLVPFLLEPKTADDAEEAAPSAWPQFGAAIKRNAPVDPKLVADRLKKEVGLLCVEQLFDEPAPSAAPVLPPPPPKTSRKTAGVHPLDGVTLGNGVDWTQPQGVLGAMSQWICDTARRPNRPLATAASVAVLSTLCGRHLYGPTGTSLNLYIVLLAETGVGKDRALKATRELLASCGRERLHQTAKIFSVSGFEQLVAERPVCTAVVDEVATNLLARISNKRANSSETTIKGALQELWSRSIGDGPFQTTRRAVLTKERVPPTVEVLSPSLTLFGRHAASVLFRPHGRAR